MDLDPTYLISVVQLRQISGTRIRIAIPYK
ncbi:hypothetical protein CLU93_2604 [Janthinobacterium sp. 35]|nr:hypothetical protein CLU93_2604 [Janthinobacterium sp. 35]